MALWTPEVLRMLEEVNSDTTGVDGEQPACEDGSDDDLQSSRRVRMGRTTIYIGRTDMSDSSDT